MASDDETLVPLLVTRDELSSILWALTEYRSSTLTYARRLDVSEQPAVTDLCCAAHRRSWEDRKHQFDVLSERAQSLTRLIESLEETEKTTGAEDDQETRA